MADAEPLPDARVKALLGRVPSKADRDRLARVRDALGIKSTDAVWDIMIALDYHLQLYAAVPDKIAEQTRVAAVELGRIVEGAKRRERSGRGELVASMGVPTTSPAAAGALGAVAVAFGGICIAAGYLMARRDRPVLREPSESPRQRVPGSLAAKSSASALEVALASFRGAPAVADASTRRVLPLPNGGERRHVLEMDHLVAMAGRDQQWRTGPQSPARGANKTDNMEGMWESHGATPPEWDANAQVRTHIRQSHQSPDHRPLWRALAASRQRSGYQR